MIEITPIAPSFQVVKPKKIKRDDNRPEKQPSKNKQKMEEPHAEPIQHIDEIV